MFSVWPVYPHWVCINESDHEALSPAPAYPLQPKAKHLEVTTACGLYLPSQKFSKTVKFDGWPLALDGHDAGMLILHVTLAPFVDNIMLPLTLLGTSTKWPFAAYRRKVEGTTPSAFFPVAVPYTFCHSRAKASGPKKPDAPEAPAAPAPPPSSSGATQAATPSGGGNLQMLKEGVPGLGIFSVSALVGRTVEFPFSITDWLLGAARMLMDIALNVAFSQAFKAVKIDLKASDKLKPLQNEALGYLGTAAANNKALRDHLERQATDCFEAYARRKILQKMIQDPIKSYVGTGTVKLPYGLAKLDPNTGDVKLFGWSTNTGWAMAGEFKGIKGTPVFTWCDPAKEEEPPGTCDGVAEPQMESVDESDLVSEEETIGECEDEDEPEEPLGPYEPEPEDPWADYWLDEVPHAS